MNNTEQIISETEKVLTHPHSFFYEKKNIELLNDIIILVQKYSDRNIFKKYGFYSGKHCLAVQKEIISFLGSARFDNDNKINDIHKFILICSAWVHVIEISCLDAKCESVKFEFYEELDDKISTFYGQSQYSETFKKLFDIVFLSKRKIPNRYDWEGRYILSGIEIHIPLIACYFVLGYKFHVNHIESNNDNILYDFFIKDDEKNSLDLKIQLLKSIFLTGQHLLNRDEKTIVIQLNWPDKWIDQEYFNILKQEIIERLIKLDLDEVLYDVKDSLLSYTFWVKESDSTAAHSHSENIFIDVKIKYSNFRNKNGVYFIGDHEIDESGIRQIVENAALLVYPNASKLINITLENIERIKYVDDKNKKERYERINHLIEELLKNRPCHAGLMIIHAMMQHLIAFLDANTEEEGKRAIDRFEKKISKMKKIKEKSLEHISKYSFPLLLDGGNILLYGYSHTITSILKYFAVETEKMPGFSRCIERVGIFIAECRNKTIKKYDNSYWYNDAIEYSKSICQGGWKKKPIHIVPESVLANLFSEKGLISKIFIGANGIDLENGFCAHSAGHLFLVDLANKYKIPVYVFADTLKFYNLEEVNFYLDGTCQQPKYTRTSTWLSSDKILEEMVCKYDINSNRKYTCDEFIDSHKFNRREDVISKDSVSLFVTNMGISHPYSLKNLQEKISNSISKLIDPSEDYIIS